MTSLSRLRRRAPWISGALLLALIGLPVLVGGARFGVRHWPFILGAAAILLLLAGWLERLWQSRALPRLRSSDARKRLRVLRGGLEKGRPPKLDGDDDTEEPKWLM